jgi:hypothetical protein
LCPFHVEKNTEAFVSRFSKEGLYAFGRWFLVIRQITAMSMVPLFPKMTCSIIF